MYKFTTIIIHEGKWYVARCLELGVVSQGKTIAEAKVNLREAVALYLDGRPQEKKYLLRRNKPLISTLELGHV